MTDHIYALAKRYPLQEYSIAGTVSDGWRDNGKARSRIENRLLVGKVLKFLLLFILGIHAFSIFAADSESVTDEPEVFALGTHVVQLNDDTSRYPPDAGQRGPPQS